MKTPWWMTILILVLMMPLAAYPSLLHNAPDDSVAKTLLWFYPAYVVCAGVCAWICYPSRREITWILLALLALTHIGMWFL